MITAAVSVASAVSRRGAINGPFCHAERPLQVAGKRVDSARA